MEDLFRAYLVLLSSIGEKLDALTDLARQKAAAVSRDDLIAMDGVIKQEQAMTLAFRGLEQQREKLTGQLQLQKVPLSRLPARFPASMQPEAQAAADALKEKYDLYKTVSGYARSLLEEAIAQVDSVVAQLGGTIEEEGGPGYTGSSEPEPPPSMKTDFRA